MKNTTNPPGQVTLGDYLTPRYPEEMKKKLTFDEWSGSVNLEDRIDHIDFVYHGEIWDLLEMTWKAAQENL